MTTTNASVPVAHKAEGSRWYHDFAASPAARYWAAVVRILLGFTFLWAFLDKTFGLQFTTAKGSGWLDGGSPTYGFLKFGTNPEGPFASTYQGLASTSAGSWVNWLFMLGLLGIGLSFILGVFMRIGAISGVVMLVLMYFAESPFANTVDPKTGAGAFNNPIVDDHIVYAATMIVLMLLMAGNTWGLGKVWQSTHLVKSQPWLA